MPKSPIELEICAIHPNAAGIDIGAESHWVSVPPERDSESVREFGCFTGELHAMADWLKQCGVTTVAMESTGVLLDTGVSNFGDQWICGVLNERSSGQNGTGTKERCA